MWRFDLNYNRSDATVILDASDRFKMILTTIGNII